MAHTYEELHKMTVAQLREIAKEQKHDALKGYTTMHKEPLLLALCEALGIEAHEHHEVVGINKAAVKKKLRQLKEKRAEALAAHSSQDLKRVRRRMRRLKRRIKKATV